MTIKIFDRANGLLQLEIQARTADEAWAAFGDVLGYEKEEKGVFEKSAYVWTDKAEIKDISECKAF